MSAPASPKQPLPSEPLPTSPPPSSAPPKRVRQSKRHQSVDPPKDKPNPPTPAAAPPPPLVHSTHYPTPPGPVFQPYHPAYPIMNPSYPMNGSPYPHYQPIGQQQPQNPSQPPPHPQYAYAMHPGYGHHPSYPPYPQYHHQPMMMYPPAARHGVPEAPQTPSAQSASASTAGSKRKRKNEGGRAAGDKNSDDEAPATASEPARSAHGQQAASDLKKRTKTACRQRACDSCRSRKIRCDILPDTEPPVCQHCKQYSFECTFFLPITETRFKKKKLEDDSTNTEKDKEKQPSAPAAASSSSQDAQPTRDLGVIGPTAATYLLHSQASISSRVYESYDQRYNHTFSVTKSGDGVIHVQKPTAQEQQQVSPPKPVDVHVEHETIESLLNAYFTEIAPMLPIITKAEFLDTPNPAPILLYSMCLVAAARREVPQKVFDSIRYTVNNIIKAEDVLSTASIVNVQALLILCMSGDCHSQFVPSALSALWIRLGSAIRMAQDLGLHRAETLNVNIEQRRRLWGACLICDRWASIAYGHPSMIDVQDCDARLPSSGDLSDLYLDELVRLSIILGRVQKAIYTPSGLTFTSDDMLYELLADMQRWKEGLPDNLRFSGPNSSQNAGLLHLLYACVCMMFWRVFMRISYSCPAHLKFSLTVEQWTELVTLTGECIDWLDANERVYDVWLLIAYASTSCALVQYHTFIRRKDADAQDKLRKLRDCIRRWEGSILPDHMSARRKTAEIISLLYEATLGPSMPMETPALNPTGGVKGRPPVLLDYRKDPTRPGGGVFVAQDNGKTTEALKDVPEGTIINASEEEDADAAGSVDGDGGGGGEHDPQQQRGAVSQGGHIVPPSNSTPMVSFTPLSIGAAGTGRGNQYSNVNPAMNLQASQNASTNVQVMNVLDGSQSGTAMADLALADNGFLEGIPGGMFDWGQWDAFFSRFSSQGGNTTGNVSFAQAQAQAQQQQSQVQQRTT